MTGRTPRTAQPRFSSGKQGDPAVTPVIGAVLILGITVLGIAGVMLWGAPLVERVQAQNAQSAIVGEFEELRDSSRELSVPDHSRFPTIIVPRGEVSLSRGSRMLITSDRDTGFTNCDFVVRDWADTAAASAATVSATNCRGGALLEAYSVSGSTLVQYTTNPATAPGGGGTSYTIFTVVNGTTINANLAEGDWLFRLTHDDCGATDICAESWLHSTDEIGWGVDTASGRRMVHLDNGAIFSEVDGTTFLEREASIGDAVFGADYYGLWVRSLTAADYQSISGQGSHQVYLSLLGNYDRADASGVSRLRIDISGDLAQAWCNALVARNDGLVNARYQSQAADCAQVTSDGVRSVCYARVAAGVDPCSAVGSSFSFRLLHARIYTSFAL